MSVCRLVLVLAVGLAGAAPAAAQPLNRLRLDRLTSSELIQSGIGRYGSFASLPDVTGDGVAELAVGASEEGNGRGNVYVYDLVAQQVVRVIASPQTVQAERFGSTVMGLPDLDGDGRGDLAVWAAAASVGELAGAGRVYVLSGATGAVDPHVHLAQPGRRRGVRRPAGERPGRRRRRRRGPGRRRPGRERARRGRRPQARRGPGLRLQRGHGRAAPVDHLAQPGRVPALRVRPQHARERHRHRAGGAPRRRRRRARRPGRGRAGRVEPGLRQPTRPSTTAGSTSGAPPARRPPSCARPTPPTGATSPPASPPRPTSTATVGPTSWSAPRART